MALFLRDVLLGLRNVTDRLFEHSGHTPRLKEPQAFDEVLLDRLEANRSGGGAPNAIRP